MLLLQFVVYVVWCVCNTYLFSFIFIFFFDYAGWYIYNAHRHLVAGVHRYGAIYRFAFFLFSLFPIIFLVVFILPVCLTIFIHSVYCLFRPSNFSWNYRACMFFSLLFYSCGLFFFIVVLLRIKSRGFRKCLGVFFLLLLISFLSFFFF